MYTHRGAYLNALGPCTHQGLDTDTLYLWTLPMFQCNGWCSACERQAGWVDTDADELAEAMTATRDGDSWVLNCHKRWIGNGAVADVVVVWARDDGNVGGFVVEHSDGPEYPVPGYMARTIRGKAADRAVWQAQTALDGVRVPASNRLAGSRSFADTNKVLAEARDILGGNGILLEHHGARHHADIQAVYTYEGTDTVRSLIVGRAITGLAAFT